ncbi:MAG: nucleotidyltransferase domain-containing protein [Candidatus Doudnabacteria bacterium]|nr:nucleotidyltransferase domain-containing protein [Candidatus Doudnabacteria bacterium]
MLNQRILNTLKFFDLQDTPLTLFELHKFLLGDKELLVQVIDSQHEVVGEIQSFSSKTKLFDVMISLQTELLSQVEQKHGHYCLKGREKIIEQRLENYFYGFKREKMIRRYLNFLNFIPFVRGVAIGGSQALGQQKENSDIDLLIFTEKGFIWLARTLVSLYFQIFGVRRYKLKTKNRFCLNHYLARPKTVDREKNLYKAMEYARLRPVVGERVVAEFQNNNFGWIRLFFPNFQAAETVYGAPKVAQKFIEKLLTNRFGKWLENFLKRVEISSIKQDRFTFITSDELSFHPESRHVQLLDKFFLDMK